MGEEFQGGVCGGTWWNPPRDLFSGGGSGGLSSPCSVAQLGTTGGYDVMSNFIWPNEAIKNNELSTFVCDNSMVFEGDMDSTLDNIFGFGPSPTSSTTNWNQPNQFCNQEGSPPMAVMASNSNNSGDSSSSFPMNSSASYLIQTLFDDIDNNSNNIDQLINQNYAIDLQPPPLLDQLAQLDHDNNNNKLDHGSMNNMMMINGCQGSFNCEYSNETALSNIQATLLNSLQSRNKVPTLNKKSRTSCAKVNNEEVREVKKNVNEPPPAKRLRIETPSPLPTFKVRKEKLGDRITALQQLVSPFGKTDTASVLHEAIEYIKFLHDQVNVLSTPYLKNGAPIQQHQQDAEILKDKEESKQDLRNRGLCLVPISSTYPVAQETSVDFWTPTFGESTF